MLASYCPGFWQRGRAISCTASLAPAFSFHVEARVHVGSHEFYPAIRAFSLEGLLPSLTVSHLEFRNLGVIFDLLLLDSFFLVPLRLPLPLLLLVLLMLEGLSFSSASSSFCRRIEGDLRGSRT
jgi:hypothetical protein